MERMKIAAIFADQESLGGKEVTVSTMDLTPLDITVTADMNCSEILSLISKDSPNVDNYQDFEGYKRVSLSIVTLSDREVSCLVFETNDGRKPLRVIRL